MEEFPHERAWMIVSGLQRLYAVQAVESLREIACRVAMLLLEGDGAACDLGEGDEGCISLGVAGADGASLTAPIQAPDRCGWLEVRWSSEAPREPSEAAVLQLVADATSAMARHLGAQADRGGSAEPQGRSLAGTDDSGLVDDLTGMLSHRGFALLGEHHLGLLRRQATEAAVVFIDVDGVASINQRFGFQAGSRAIAEVAAVLQANCRASDVLGRVGDDDFAILLVNPQGRELQVLRRIEADLAAKNQVADRDYDLSISCGLVDSWAADDFEELLSVAREAMSRDKAAKHRPL